MSRTRAQSGFTLVELLVAIAVFAVMAAIAYGGLSSVIDTRDSIDAALDRSKMLQMATWRLQQDIEQVVARPVRNRFGDAEPAVMGNPDTGLKITRDGWPNPLSEPRSTLQRVHYQLGPHGHLVRSYYRVLDQAQDSAPVKTDLLDGVTQIEWRFLDKNGQWQDRWPPQNNGAVSDLSNQATQPPPVAIELRLDTRAWGHLRLLFAMPGAHL
ncbi:type II secretion system minor pseudopilin GspJ [Salinisphaera sp. LB1]|uniref:type II secretion system minor pseudopilin GspJ n=1 Tax=Salinisphaera sp. LB1 TaxID=2183911 RepID=UPI000D70782D|nr:type II secretion system minor pseudopilin GspJ [Salinisphaera sp. LB1]AWN17306.1 General secretion pathway protein J [Salinisphaera sp. LB1]